MEAGFLYAVRLNVGGEMKGIFRKKDMSGSTGEFQRSLGLMDVTFIGVGAVIGAGIFVITGQAAATMAGGSNEQELQAYLAMF